MRSILDQMIDLDIHYTECRRVSIDKEYEIIEIKDYESSYEIQIDLEEFTMDEIKEEWKQAYQELKASQE